MARRRIGQEQLRFDPPQSRQSGSLDEITGLIDWAEIDRLLASIHASAKGEPSWPPLALFKALLLSVWYDLSDVRLAEALEDRASFRCFCGFARDEPTPERTAFVRFRRELVSRGLDRALFEAVTRQLVSKGIRVKRGTLVDATVIASATMGDDEAAWSTCSSICPAATALIISRHCRAAPECGTWSRSAHGTARTRHRTSPRRRLLTAPPTWPSTATSRSPSASP